MNRLDELNSMLDESMEIPEALNIDTIRRETKKRAFRHRVIAATRNVAVGVVIFMVVLTVGVNTSPVFATTVKDIPLIGKLAWAVDFNKNIEDAFNYDYGVEIGQKAEGEITDLEISYAMADDRSLALFIKADDDGGKYEGNIQVDKMIDTDTGEEICASYSCPEISTNGEYAVLLYQWEHYCRNVSVDLSFVFWDDNTNPITTEKYSFKFSVGDKLEPKVYEVDKNYTIDTAKYYIDKVIVYPMSTEIHVRYLNEDEVFTRWMEFELVDENGEVRAATKNGTIGREVEKGYNVSVIESGYFAYEGNLKLRISHVELISAARRRVALNLDTLKFTEELGEIKEITDVSRVENEIEFKVNGELGKFSNLFEGYINEDGNVEHNPEEGFRGDGYGCIFLNGVDGSSPIYVNEDNEVTLLRLFPEKIIYPDITIEL